MTFSQTTVIPDNQEQGNNYAISNADVYIRDGPSSQYYAIGVINKGDTVLILESSKSIWSKIQYKDVTRYTSRKFLENIEIETSQLVTSQTSPEPLKEEPSKSNFYIGTALLFFIFF